MSQYPYTPYGYPVSQSPSSSHGGQRPQQSQQSQSSMLPSVPHNIAAAAGLGALIGATGAAAHAIHQARQGNMTNQEAAIHTVKEAAGTGLATAAAVGVVGSTSMHGALGIVGLLAVGTGVKYMWDQTIAPACESICSDMADKASAALGSDKDAAVSED